MNKSNLDCAMHKPLLLAAALNFPFINQCRHAEFFNWYIKIANLAMEYAAAEGTYYNLVHKYFWVINEELSDAHATLKVEEEKNIKGWAHSYPTHIGDWLLNYIESILTKKLYWIYLCPSQCRVVRKSVWYMWMDLFLARLSSVRKRN